MINALQAETLREDLGVAISAVVKDERYGFRESQSSNRNVALSYVGELGDATIRVDLFKGMCLGSIASPSWAIRIR